MGKLIVLIYLFSIVVIYRNSISQRSTILLLYVHQKAVHNPSKILLLENIPLLYLQIEQVLVYMDGP